MRLTALAALATTLSRYSMVKVAATSPSSINAVASAARSVRATANPLEGAIAKAQRRELKREQKKAKKLQKQQQKQAKAQDAQHKQHNQHKQHKQQLLHTARPEQLVIVGLGNVGEKYTMTRHNVGFLVADALAERLQLHFAQHRSLQALVASGTMGNEGRTVHIVKPTTMMNLSGDSVRRVLAAHSLPQSSVLVVVDDIAIPFGALRMRLKGSAGGHNGLKDIERQLGSQEYARLRVGVGAAGTASSLVDHVLGNFDQKEQSVLPQVLQHVAERCEHWITEDDVQKVIEKANTKR